MVLMAIPVDEPNGLASEIMDHFGLAEDFAVFEYEDGVASGLRFIHNKPKQQDTKNNAELLADEGVKIVLAGSIGPHMISVLLARGLRLFHDAEGTVADALEDYRAGMLGEVTSAGTMI